MTNTLDLMSILADAGVENLREGTKEVTGSCPQHFERIGKIDHNPTWSMNKHSFLHNCFSCHYSGTLTGLLIDITGYAPDDLEEQLAKMTIVGRMTKAEERRGIAEAKPEQTLLNDWSLANLMKDVPQRLVDFRHLQRTAVDVYGVRWDPERKSWVLPVRDGRGSLIGAQFRQKGNELNLPAEMEKSKSVFGLKEMSHYDTVALVESPLDAVRMYGVGIPAVSSYGAWVSWDQCRLMAPRFKRVILALDNDDPGRKGSEVARTWLKKMGTVASRFYYDGLLDADGRPAKDPGDVVDDNALRQAWLKSLSFGR